MKILRFCPLLFSALLTLGCGDFNHRMAVESEHTIKDSAFLSISSAQVKPESEFEIIFAPSEQVEITEAHIVGASMYMGKIPLFFKKTQNGSHKAVGMVGVCSEKEMKWQIQIFYKDMTLQQQKTATLNFVATNV